MSLPYSSSYIIVRESDGAVLGETWNRSVANRMHQKKGMKAVPIKDYLASLNRKETIEMTEIEHATECTFDAIAAAKKGVEKMPASRERSLALTKLDEAHMWFQRAIPPSNTQSTS